MLTHHLMDHFEFTDADLRANREGLLSSAQTAKIEAGPSPLRIAGQIALVAGIGIFFMIRGDSGARDALVISAVGAIVLMGFLLLMQKLSGDPRKVHSTTGEANVKTALGSTALQVGSGRNALSFRAGGLDGAPFAADTMLTVYYRNWLRAPRLLSVEEVS